MTTSSAGLAQHPRDVAAAGGDVERLSSPSAHSAKSSRSRPLLCASLSRYASARSDQTSVMPRAPPRASPRRASSARRGCSPGRALGEDLPPLLRVRAVEADDDRVLDRGLVERLQHPARDLVAARDPAEDVEEDRLHLRVGADDLERIDHALRVTAAAEVAEVRRPPAGERDHVQRRHDEAGAVAEDPDLAVELHVRDAFLARGALLGRVRLEVAHLGDVGVLVERVVVDRELRVERLDLALGRHDQRVDLAEHRVGADERVVELLDDGEDLLLLVRVVDPGARRSGGGPGRAGSPRAGRRAACASASGRSAATSSMSIPPSFVSMKSAFFSPRSNVTER